MNEITFRLADATFADAELVRQAEHTSLGDSSYTAAEIAEILARPEQRCYLALAEPDGAPAGLCSCLLTADTCGSRLELDLLGVQSAYRGRGIATRLISLALSRAAADGIQCFRAVVAQDNLASQRAFMRAGLAKSAEASSLMVYRLDGTLPQHSLPDGLRLQVAKAPYPLPNGAIRTQRAQLLHASETLAEAQLVRVQTLVYAGVWIESLRGDEEPIIHLLRALLVWAAQERLDEVGVHCMADPELPAALWRAGFIELGSYYQFSASRPGGLFGVPDVPDGA